MEKMLQLPVIFVLIISVFAASVPVDTSPKDGHDIGAVSTAAKVDNGATNITTGNNTVTNASSVQAAENKTGDPSSNKTSEPPKNVTKEKEKHKCSSVKEQDDKRDCQASPHDSGEDTDDNSSETTPGPTPVTKSVTENTEANKKSIAPTDDTQINAQKTNESIHYRPLNSTETMHFVTYDIASTETIHVTKASSTEESLKPTVKPATANDTVTENNSVAPLVAHDVTNTDSEGVVTEVKSADRNKSMPSGVIALIIAISFGVAIAIVYIGMIVWRRYIEYRYGHRELLVNELEFDTNDLRHFEL